MTDASRRHFVKSASLLGATAAMSEVVAAQSLDAQLPQLVHMVYFWLKRPDSRTDRDELIAGLKALGKIPEIKALHIGIPASTEKREVVDNSFQVSEMMLFSDVQAQNTYQSHPLHRQFIKDCEHLWERVVVYDSIAVD